MADEEASEKRPELTVVWTTTEQSDEDAYRRLLKLLFSPRADSDAA